MYDFHYTGWKEKEWIKSVSDRVCYVYKHLRIFFTGIQNHTQIKHCEGSFKDRNFSVLSSKIKSLCRLKPGNDPSSLYRSSLRQAIHNSRKITLRSNKLRATNNSGRKTTSHFQGIRHQASVKGDRIKVEGYLMCESVCRFFFLLI